VRWVCVVFVLCVWGPSQWAPRCGCEVCLGREGEVVGVVGCGKVK